MNRTTGHDSERQIEFSLSDVYEILYRRRLMLLLGVALGLLAAFYIADRPRKFRSEGSIRIQPSRGAMYRTSPIASAGEGDQIASEIAILQSRTLYLRVARELDLANQPAFWGRLKIDHVSIDNPQIRDAVIQRMQAKIKVEHSPKDDIVRISATTTSRDLSATIVNTLINDYVESLFKMSFGATQRASNWLIGQLDDLKQQIERDQTTLTQLQGKLGLIGIDQKSSNYLLAESLDQITKASSDATIQRILAEAKYRFVSESDPALLDTEQPLLSGSSAGQAGLLQSLRSDQARSADAYAKLSAQFGPNYPELKHAKAELDAINAQVKVEQDRIINQAKLAYKAASTNEQMTNGAATKIRTEAANSQSDMVKYSILLHDYEAHRSLYEGLVQRLREAGITSGMESGEIDIVDLADAPSMPESPGPVTVIIGGLFAGVLLGCFIALIAELLDAKISSTEQADKLIPLPLLAAIPRVSAANIAEVVSRHQPEVLLQPRSAYAESLQSLRTSLLLMNRPNPCQVILVTSALPGEGKSTTARNLATIFSQHSSRTILIDCDLRRGRVANSLGLRNSPGLSGILMDRSTVEAAAFSTPGAERLFVVPSGPYPPQAAVLVSSQSMIDLLEICKKNYDYVILDCPPVIGLTDSLILAEHADAVLMVVREDYSRKRAVRDAVRSLSMLRNIPMGFVMNSVDDKAHSYGYGRYYSAYYGDPKDGKAA